MATPRAIRRPLAHLAVLAALLGCTGSLSDGPTRPVGSIACAGRPPELAVPMRRLMPDEYQSAIATIFGSDVPDVSTTYPVPLRGYEYTTYADAHRVSELQAEALLESAELVAEHLAPRLPDCAGMAFDVCARATLTPWIDRAFRRPAESADVDRLVAVATGAQGDGLAPNEALAVAVIALLNEPRFLYVIESRPDVAAWTLDGHERAQRLALTFWRALPDDALLASAASGMLDTPDAMRATAERMIDDPRTRTTFQRFVREWLHVGRHPPVHPPAVLAALEGELERLIDDAWAAEDGVATLLSADTVYADSVLEELYGLPRASTGPGDFRRTSMPGERIGILTHPLVLAGSSHGEDSSPILRGALVRTRLLCGELGTPPVGAMAMEPALPATATVRQRYEARIRNGICAQCHRQMDPIGFGLERWDGLGRTRTMVGAHPVDDRAEITLGGDTTGEYAGPEELLAALATSDDVTECFARQWTRYALGRDEDEGTMCSARALGAELIESGRSIPSLLSSFAAGEGLVHRSAEVIP